MGTAARLNANGSVDKTFNKVGEVVLSVTEIQSIAVDSDGHIILAGDRTTTISTSEWQV